MIAECEIKTKKEGTNGMNNLCRTEDIELLRRVQSLHGEGEDRIVGFIYETEEYGKFKKLIGNREIDERNRARLEVAMLHKQLPIPGLVNEKDEVIDAQTRLDIEKANGLPFIYTVGPGLNVTDCRIANTNSKHWTLRNALNTFAVNGNENYIRFIKLLDEFQISESTAMKASGAYFHNAKDRDLVINEGALVLTNDRYLEGREILSKAVQCYETLNSKKKATKREALIQAFMACAKTVGYEHSRMVKACEQASLSWIDSNKFVEILEQIAQYYNYRRKQNFMDVIRAKKNTRPVFTAAENNYQ